VKLGLPPRRPPAGVLTSTPKANKLTKDLVAIPAGALVVVRGSSYENRDEPVRGVVGRGRRAARGDADGRQEIEAEMLEDVEGALWTKALIDATRVDGPAADLAGSSSRSTRTSSSDEAANAAGIVVAGARRPARRLGGAHGYVLDDRTIDAGGPRAWAQAAVDAYHEWQADRIVARRTTAARWSRS
jgi:phage terminase large subunit-like protein